MNFTSATRVVHFHFNSPTHSVGVSVTAVQSRLKESRSPPSLAIQDNYMQWSWRTDQGGVQWRGRAAAMHRTGEGGRALFYGIPYLRRLFIFPPLVSVLRFCTADDTQRHRFMSNDLANSRARPTTTMRGRARYGGTHAKSPTRG